MPFLKTQSRFLTLDGTALRPDHADHDHTVGAVNDHLQAVLQAEGLPFEATDITYTPEGGGLKAEFRLEPHDEDLCPDPDLDLVDDLAGQLRLQFGDQDAERFLQTLDEDTFYPEDELLAWLAAWDRTGRPNTRSGPWIQKIPAALTQTFMMDASDLIDSTRAEMDARVQAMVKDEYGLDAPTATDIEYASSDFGEVKASYRLTGRNAPPIKALPFGAAQVQAFARTINAELDWTQASAFLDTLERRRTYPRAEFTEALRTWLNQAGAA